MSYTYRPNISVCWPFGVLEHFSIWIIYGWGSAGPDNDLSECFIVSTLSVHMHAHILNNSCAHTPTHTQRCTCMHPPTYNAHAHADTHHTHIHTHKPHMHTHTHTHAHIEYTNERSSSKLYWRNMPNWPSECCVHVRLKPRETRKRWAEICWCRANSFSSSASAVVFLFWCVHKFWRKKPACLIGYKKCLYSTTNFYPNFFHVQHVHLIQTILYLLNLHWTKTFLTDWMIFSYTRNVY